MEETSNHIQAFPDKYETGMTLRDYFAAKAMNGICADGHTFWDNSTLQGDPLEIARLSYEIADAMLKQREK
ncbi:hypothetical protein UFOVP54_201 [uncultured Caudovirales phage]|uniref:Uncharacterized protein n=1 Tax=uncultured Caudovirales phage TaxID=2100421 RepID=A0A6J5KX87_9CAUD|nr:hypothetical protein UFOVP54_201 [uncultured Caudovirales phage]